MCLTGRQSDQYHHIGQHFPSLQLPIQVTGSVLLPSPLLARLLQRYLLTCCCKARHGWCIASWRAGSLVFTAWGRPTLFWCPMVRSNKFRQRTTTFCVAVTCFGGSPGHAVISFLQNSFSNSIFISLSLHLYPSLLSGYHQVWLALGHGNLKRLVI